jgi:hypothetical protein
VDAAKGTNGFMVSIRHPGPFPALFRKGAGGADGDTGSAEFTFGFNMGKMKRRTHFSIFTPFAQVQDKTFPMFGTYTDAAAAVNTKVVIPVKEWIILFYFQVLVVDREFNLFNAHVFDYALQFTIAILGAPPAAGGGPYFANS